MKQHMATGKSNPVDKFFNFKYAKPGTSYDDMRKHEKDKNEQHAPSGNKRAGDGGRPPNK